MSKHQKQMQILRSSPRAQMTYQLNGRLPAVAPHPSSPLIDLLASISPRDRLTITGVHLSPSLGYQSGQVFQNAEQLFRWLKPEEWVAANSTSPAESRRIKSFCARLTLKDLLENAASYPDTLKFSAD